MYDLNVVQIKDSIVQITDKDGTSMGAFDIVSLQTNFMVGSIPTCTATLSLGTALGEDPSAVNVQDTVSELIQKNGSSKLRLYIEFTIGYYSSSVDTSSTSTISVPIFDGVISSISIGQSASAYGGSRFVIAVTAHHRFCELYQWGTNGMIYATPEAVIPGTNISTIIQDNTSDAGAEGTTTSTTLVSKDVISEVLQNTCRPPVGSSSKKDNSPIVDILSEFIGKMQDSGAIKPEGKVNIGGSKVNGAEGKPYLNGSTALSNDFQQGYYLIKKMLEALWISINKTSIGSTLLGTLTSPELFLAFVPTSVDTITILPYDCISVNKSAPIINPDMYTNIQLVRSTGMQPEPSGVIVSASNNVLMYNAQNSAVVGRYPNSKDKSSIMWATVQAPGWLVTEDASYEASYDPGKKESSSANTGANKDNNCNAYAEWVYRRFIGKNNSCTMSVPIKHIEAFKALGTVCIIQGTMYGNLQGYLNSYTLSYSQNVDKSGMDIKLSFTHILPYIKEGSDESAINKQIHQLFTCAAPVDSGAKFPDISDRQ